ncbi:MAG: hypothetical protein ACRCUY_13340 [Thermoguttaceae bacterium]
MAQQKFPCHKKFRLPHSINKYTFTTTYSSPFKEGMLDQGGGFVSTNKLEHFIVVLFLNKRIKKITVMFRFSFAFLCCCLFVIVTFGCKSNQTYKQMAAKNHFSKNSPKIPTQMVDVWQTYAESNVNGVPMRGVGGRILFYQDAKRKIPVKVDGDLTVFIFDGNEKNPATAKPLWVHKFSAETLAQHYSYKKPLGHGYDFFLPCDVIDGEERKLSVMARFDDHIDDRLIVSAPVSTLLRGTRRQTDPDSSVQEFFWASRASLVQANEEIMRSQNVMPASFNSEQNTSEVRQSGDMTATNSTNSTANQIESRAVATISLNDNWSRRLAQSQISSNELRQMESANSNNNSNNKIPIRSDQISEQKRVIESASWQTENGEKSIPSARQMSGSITLFPDVFSPFQPQ